MYLTIYNPNTYSIRVRVTRKTLLSLKPKSSVSIAVDRKYFKQLKLDPKIYLHKAVPYESFLQVLKKNSALKAEVSKLQKELKTLRQAGIVEEHSKSISELLNVALEKIDSKGKIAIFQALIEENLRIRDA